MALDNIFKKAREKAKSSDSATGAKVLGTSLKNAETAKTVAASSSNRIGASAPKLQFEEPIEIGLDFNTQMSRLQELRRQAAVDLDTALVDRLDKQMQALRTSAGKQTASDRVNDILSSALSSSVGSVVNAAGVGANAVIDPERNQRNLNRLQETLDKGYTTDGQKLSDTQKETLRQSIADLQKQLEKSQSKDSIQNKLYQAADRMTADSAKFQSQAKQGLGALGQFGVDVAIGGLQLAGDIGLGAVTGLGAMAPIAVRGFGSGAQEARQDGATLGQQMAYGIGSAAVEALTEKLSSVGVLQKTAFGAPILKSVDDMLEGVVAAIERAGKTEAGKAILNRLASAGVGFLSEGTEEMISGLVNPVLKKATYSDEAIDWKQTWDDALYEFLVGGAIGAIGGGIGGTDTTRSVDKASAASYNENQTTVSPAAAPQVQQVAQEEQITRAVNPESEVLSTGATLYTELGMRPNRAKEKAEIVQRLVAGEKVDVKDINKLNLTDKAYRAVFTQLTGVQFPEGRLSNEQVHNLARSAGQEAAAAKEAAEIQQEKAFQEAAQAQVEQLEQESVAVEPESAAGETVSFSEFMDAYRAQVDPNVTREEAARQYEQYLNDAAGQPEQTEVEAVTTTLGQKVTRAQFHELYRANAEQTMTDDELDGLFNGLLAKQRAEESVEARQGGDSQKARLEQSVSRWRQVLNKTTAVKDVVLDDTLRDNEGAYYDKDTGVIHLNPKRAPTEEAVSQLVSHELVHSVQDDARTQLIEDIIGALGSAQERDQRVRELQESYQRHENAAAYQEGREARVVDTEYATEEYAAMLVQEAFKSDEMLTKLAQEKPSLIQRVKQIIDDLVEALKGNANAVAERRELEALQTRFAEALKASAENAENGAKFSLSSDTSSATMKETTQEGTGYGTDEARAETEEDFIRRSHEAAREVRTGAGFVFGYRRPVLLRSVSGSATEAQRALSELGIPSEVVEGGIEWNRNGVTRSRDVKEATNLAGQLVVISNAADIAPLNVAGHEAYHFKRNTSERGLYSDVVGANLLFGSEAFMRYQQKIADAYFAGDVDVSDIRQYAKFEEELFAYISGDLHEGTNEQYLRPMFRDFEAVKQAWSAFTQSMKHQESEKSGASSLPERSYTYEALTSKPDIVVTQVPMRTVPTKGKRLNVSDIAKAGREQAELRQGADTQQRVVFIPDLKADVLIGAPGARHGLTGNKTNSGTMNTAEVTYALPRVLQNSVAVNEQNPRAEGDGEYSYVLFGYARREDGKEYLVKSVVNHFADNKSVVEDVEVYDVLKGIKARKTKDPQMEVFNSVSGSQGSHTGSPAARHPNGTASAAAEVIGSVPQTGASFHNASADTISVAELLDVVKENYPELLPKSVREHYGITEPAQAPNLRYSITQKDAEWYNSLFGTDYTADSLKERLSKAAEEHGTIPAGERAYRESQIPRSMTGKDRVSQAARTVYEAKATPAERLQTIEDVVAKGQVSDFSIENKITGNRARAKLKRDGWTKAYTDWISDVRAGKVSADLMAMGAHLLNNAGNNTEATAEQYAELFIEYAELNRNAGRSLQAAHILKTLSPEGKLYGLQRYVDKMNEGAEQRASKKKGFDPEKWAKEQKITIDPELMQRYRDAKTDEERDAVMTELQQSIADQMPASLSEKLNNWRYLAMLGNFKTQGRNLLGNAMFQIPRLIKEDVRGIMEATAQLTGAKIERTTSVMRDGASFKAALNDFKDVRAIILSGGKVNEKADYLRGIDEKRRIYKNIILESYRKATNWAMDSGDALFCQFTYADSIARFMAANGITWDAAPETMREAARRRAIKEATEATYRDSNMFSDLVTKAGIRNPKNIVQKGVNAVVEGILPFKKTPMNILVRGMEYSPAGLVNAAYTAVKAQKADSDVAAADVINALAKTLTGTGLMTLGYVLAKSGILTGSGPDDEKEKEFWELQGNQDYSIRIPGTDTWLSISFLAPEAIPMLVGANIAEQMMEGNADESTMEIGLKAISKISDPMLELSMLSGINDLLESVEYSRQNGVGTLVSNAVWSYATQYVPSLLRQAEAATDNTRRSIYTDKNAAMPDSFQYPLGKLSQAIPGVDLYQIPYVDRWGRMENNYDSRIGNAFAQFFNPAYVSEINTSEMEKELQRLYDATGDTAVLPREMPKKVTIDGVDYNFTGDQYVDYATLRGQYAYDALKEMMGGTAYQKLSDEQKIKAVTAAYDEAADIAKQDFVDRQGLDVEGGDKDEKPKLDTGLSNAEFLAVEARVKGIESLKDKDDETVINSKGLQIMEAVYDMDLRLSDSEYEALFEALGVGKTIRKYKEATVQSKLKQMRKQAK